MVHLVPVTLRNLLKPLQEILDITLSLENDPPHFRTRSFLRKLSLSLGGRASGLLGVAGSNSRRAGSGNSSRRRGSFISRRSCSRISRRTCSQSFASSAALLSASLPQSSVLRRTLSFSASSLVRICARISSWSRFFKSARSHSRLSLSRRSHSALSCCSLVRSSRSRSSLLCSSFSHFTRSRSVISLSFLSIRTGSSASTLARSSLSSFRRTSASNAPR